MTKKDLLNALEGLDDDAEVYIQDAENETIFSELCYFTDKTAGSLYMNEITLVVR